MANLLQTTTQFLLTIVLTLIAMAFLTLLERKCLGYMQLRKGPNKLSLTGLPQPMADALKLFLKSTVTPTASNSLPMLMSPILGLTLSLFLWYLYPTTNLMAHKPLGLLMFISISASMVYPILIAGWSTNSKYALLGAMRVMAQMISYEIPMILTLIFFSAIANTTNLSLLNQTMDTNFKWQLALPMTLMWLTSMLIETNRTPFDFAEGESELVSGFNVEYSGTKFALLFMSEYLNILFLSLVSSILLMNSTYWAPGFTALFIFTRGTLPRHRYDLTMSMAWKTFIPIALSHILWLLPIILLTKQ
uniref:NADH-ubiquinone oxidoreductase chain 1 n=1 Tax=Chamberlainia hainesiana TaxID=1264661 RepID=A0A513X0E0_9BIVA|nr:NADH dehydrogenase subunit 1 [Chamberlainia hainesiana]